MPFGGVELPCFRFLWANRANERAAVFAQNKAKFCHLTAVAKMQLCKTKMCGKILKKVKRNVAFAFGSLHATAAKRQNAVRKQKEQPTSFGFVKRTIELFAHFLIATRTLPQKLQTVKRTTRFEKRCRLRRFSRQFFVQRRTEREQLQRSAATAKTSHATPKFFATENATGEK